jgi:PAS domain S-box-containing protein
MKPPNFRIIIINKDPEGRSLLKERLAHLGWDASIETLQWLHQLSSSKRSTIIAFVAASTNQEIKTVQELVGKYPELQIVATAEKDRIDRAKQALGDRLHEFISNPFDPMDLEILLNRIKIMIELKCETSKAKKRAHKTAAKIIATERFLAVRQIVDKMSSFITQVTNDAQGGVKYFNELPYFVSIHSKDGRILAANPTYLRYLGNKINHPSWEIYLGKRATFNGCPVGVTVNSGDVRTTRALVRYKSAAKVPVTVHTAPIFNNEGEVELILEVFAGTKEIERLAAEIHTTQQRYEQLFDAVPSKIVVIDRRFNITATNRSFQYDFGDQIGNNFFDILRPANFPAYRDPISRTIRRGSHHSGEMVLTDLNGIQYNIMAWTAPIKTASGKLIQVLVVFTDITQMRKLQDNLASLGLMLGTISHDLKGSLTGLDAGHYLIESGFYKDKGGRIEEGLEVAKLMAGRIRKLIYDILYYAKDRQLDPVVIDVQQFAGDVAATMERKIRSANIALKVDFSRAEGTFEVDLEVLRMAMTNILENAVEACIADTVKRHHWIKFSAVANEEQINFLIADNGGGIQKQRIQNMFDLFYSTKGSKGTGLGLFITKKAIQKHGGTISVESKPGEGTSFDIQLPRRISGVFRP